ncbi:MAG: hypothetical protein QG635_1104, partial [Bacteroidota bacterium]|nr:hypothetical protein [Bacteroidota bacterium]
MKYLYTLIGLIFYIITNCEAKVYYDWELLSPKPEIMGINSMKFYDKNTGWAIGSEGLILKTTDGGENWIDKSLKNDSDIMSIIINDENTAFIVAGYSLYKTTDGGNSWVNISKVSFSNILHLKDNIGYAIDKQFPYITSDGGLTWKVFYIEHFKFNKIDDNQEIFIDDFSVLLSKDKWKSFVRMKYNNNMYYSVFNDLSFIYYIDTYNFIQFWDYHVPYYSGQHQTINISLNIKDSNTPYQTCFSNLKLNKICFLDSNICYFITDNGAIIKTSDGGRIWRVQSKWINSSIDVFQFNSEKVGFIVSNGMIYKTNDGGETWQLKPSSTYATSEKQNCITGSDSNTLWIGAGNHSQVIYKSTNKGYTWGAKHFKRNKTNIISLSKVDDSTAWALGYYGVVLKSTDKGDSWNIMLDFNKELKYICFSKKDIGWIVRYDGRVYKSTNAGETWNLLSDSIIFNVQVIKFSDELHGFAACGDGWIMRTSDGGISWQRDYMIDYDNFTDICIVDSANGWLITHYGK